MSSITLIKIRLRNVSAELLRQVVEQLCKDLGGKMTKSIQDYYGNETRVDLGFRCPQHQRGVGFVAEGGQVSIKGDFFQAYGFQQELQRRLVQGYTATAHQQALRQQGYQVQRQNVGNKVILRAFSW